MRLEVKVHIVMDGSGDTRHEFDEADFAAVAEADLRFRQLLAQGYSAIAFTGNGSPGHLIRTFDPSAERTVFVPRLVGG